MCLIMSSCISPFLSGFDPPITRGLLFAGNMLKAAYAHNIDAYQSVGAEVYKAAREDAADVHVMLGYSKRLTDGALVKARAQNSGLVTFLYESVSTTVLLLPGRMFILYLKVSF